jgi:hypothetical protein
VKPLLFLLFFGCTISVVDAKSVLKEENVVFWTDSLPQVFQIGEYADIYEKKTSQAPTLLEISQNDVYLAYDKWLHTLSELQVYCASAGLQLNGAKFWFSVLWKSNGTIDHFAFYQKSGSKIIDTAVFERTLRDFIQSYKMPIDVKTAFYNYGSAAFPLPDKSPLARKN